MRLEGAAKLLTSDSRVDTFRRHDGRGRTKASHPNGSDPSRHYAQSGIGRYCRSIRACKEHLAQRWAPVWICNCLTCVVDPQSLFCAMVESCATMGLFETTSTVESTDVLLFSTCVKGVQEGGGPLVRLRRDSAKDEPVLATTTHCSYWLPRLRRINPSAKPAHQPPSRAHQFEASTSQNILNTWGPLRRPTSKPKRDFHSPRCRGTPDNARVQ